MPLFLTARCGRRAARRFHERLAVRARSSASASTDQRGLKLPGVISEPDRAEDTAACRTTREIERAFQQIGWAPPNLHSGTRRALVQLLRQFSARRPIAAH